MRDWLGKPLLLVATIILVLGGISFWWVRSGPSPAEAENQATRTAYHRQVQQAIEDVENDR